MTDDMRETLDALERLAHALRMDLVGSDECEFAQSFHVPDWIKFNEHLNELKKWVSAIDNYEGCRHGH